MTAAIPTNKLKEIADIELIEMIDWRVKPWDGPEFEGMHALRLPQVAIPLRAVTIIGSVDSLLDFFSIICSLGLLSCDGFIDLME